jgi:inositol transport system permease protein
MIKPASSESVVERGKKIEIVGFFEKYGVLLFLVALIVIFTLYNPMFLSARNIKNILTEVSIYGIIGVGMTYVILTGGIDLAVGSLLAFAAISGAFLMPKW